ncbi:uncharacterized protein LOC113564123 [Drosophila erecta]|uniref:uncharacterized protein LOC113564123 n=1 Tax=Drosophila erecta TaxID=7220 RepID=UPI000F04FDF8|nr:uncharacterized protein LOC113564123 [Drosophila erecta]
MYLFMLSLAWWLVHILALKDPVCGLMPRVNKCVVLGKEPPVFYGYNERRNECYRIKDPCQQFFRRFATKLICVQLCKK